MDREGAPNGLPHYCEAPGRAIRLSRLSLRQVSTLTTEELYGVFLGTVAVFGSLALGRQRGSRQYCSREDRWSKRQDGVAMPGRSVPVVRREMLRNAYGSANPLR